MFKACTPICWHMADDCSLQKYILSTFSYDVVHFPIQASAYPAVLLWMESCPLFFFHYTFLIHFICTHFINQIQKVYSLLIVVTLFYIRVLDPLPDLDLSTDDDSVLVYIFLQAEGILYIDYFVISLIIDFYWNANAWSKKKSVLSKMCLISKTYC